MATDIQKEHTAFINSITTNVESYKLAVANIIMQFDLVRYFEDPEYALQFKQMVLLEGLGSHLNEGVKSGESFGQAKLKKLNGA